MSISYHLAYTYGSLLIGVLCAAYELADWYPGRKTLLKKPLDHAAALGPFAWNWVIGAMLVLYAGGAVGAATDWFVWGAGWLGDAAYVWGIGGTRQNAPTTAISQPLTAGGLFMGTIAMVVAAVRIRKGATASKKRGLASGALMGMSAGVASVAAVPIASVLNASGVWLAGAVS